jgi:membrane protein DedA with SNARE-associated domain
MNFDWRKKWLPLAILAAALVVWAIMFAIGAYLEPGADRPHHDARKAFIILVTMGAFLAFWGIALWVRARRK